MARVAPDDARELAVLRPGDDGTRRLHSYPYRPYLQGGSITMDASGRRLYALSADTGELSLIDADTLAVAARQHVCERPEQVVVAPDGRAFVSCRGDGDVVALAPDLTVTARRQLGGEPFGLALSPSGTRLLVTTATDARVVSLSQASLEIQWRRAVAAEPRGIAISANGDRATVAHLTAPGISVIDVALGHAAAAGLPARRDGWPSELFDDAPRVQPQRIAGGAYAVAASPGGTRAFVPYLLKNNGAEIDDFAPGCYANGSELPIAASVAALDFAAARVQRPALRLLPLAERGGSADFSLVSELGRLGVVRAAFHDPVRSRLFAVGEGSGLLAAFDTSKADPTSKPLAFWPLPGPARGVVVDPEGRRVFVHLALEEQLMVLELASGESQTIALGETRLPEQVARGRILFHAANEQGPAALTGVSCTSCHLDGRSDGVSWRLDGKPMQTPLLAGRRLEGTLRWHGDSPSLAHAVDEAIDRLGGKAVDQEARRALVAYLEASALPAPLNPHAASERGAALFERAGCSGCHDPANDYSDGALHQVRGQSFRTPSLRGLFLTAPYYHDGSAASLAGLLRGHDADNPMAVGDELGGSDLRDLEAYLRSL